ncbi:MAG: hypothetical protein AB7U63_19030 [Porticoccaceae bacterium]
MNPQRPWSRVQPVPVEDDNPFAGITAKVPSRLERLLYGEQDIDGFPNMDEESRDFLAQGKPEPLRLPVTHRAPPSFEAPALFQTQRPIPNREVVKQNPVAQREESTQVTGQATVTASNPVATQFIFDPTVAAQAAKRAQSASPSANDFTSSDQDHDSAPAYSFSRPRG